MKLAMKVTLGCLLLIFAILFGGCSLLPSNPISQQPSGETPKNNKAELEKQEQDKQAEIGTLKTTLLEQQRNATAERDKCNGMIEETKKLPGNKDPESLKDAPNTVAQCKLATSAENQAKDTKNKLAAAENFLAETQEKIKQLPADTSNYGWLISLLIGVAGVLGLGILLGGLYLLLSRKIDKAIATERVLNQQSFEAIRAKHNKFKDLFAEHGKVMNDLEKLVKLQQGKIQALEIKSKEGGGVIGQPQLQTFVEPQFVKPEPQFPVSAENYLNKVGSQVEMATPDKFSEGLLVQDPNKDQEFIIVKDPASADGLFYAVPKFTRFSTKSDYNLYYRNYYNCDDPAGGSVWIKSPAIMYRVEGGWRLRDKGELEVR